MRTDRESGAPQFSQRDLEKAGRRHKTFYEVFLLTADDLNLFLRVYCRGKKKRKKKSGRSCV